jgi:hypothetical protein
MARALGNPLHRAVVAVPYPARQVELLGALHGRSAKINALDAPMNFEMSAGFFRKRLHRFSFLFSSPGTVVRQAIAKARSPG